MCKSSSELLDHLLLPCVDAREFWSLVLSSFGLHWVMCRAVVEVLACWKGRSGSLIIVRFFMQFVYLSKKKRKIFYAVLFIKEKDFVFCSTLSMWIFS